MTHTRWMDITRNETSNGRPQTRLGAWTLVLPALLASCTESQPANVILLEDISSTDLSAVLVDDSLGVACFERVVRSGKTSITTIEACQSTATVSALAAGHLRQAWDARANIDTIIIDDTNGILCLRDDGTFLGCIPLAQINRDGLTALRSQASPP
jgi:hypothetical protein